MAKPTNKPDLLLAIQKEYDQLQLSLQNIPHEVMLEKGACDEWSIKDILCHLMDWDGRVWLWYAQGGRGETPKMPDPAYKWNQIPQLNQMIYEAHKDRALDEVLLTFSDTCTQSMQRITAMDEDEIFSPGYHAWTGKLPLLAYIWSGTQAHYKWARDLIRKFIKNR